MRPPPVLLAIFSGAFLILLLGFRFLDWDFGLYRTGLVLVLLAGVLLLPFVCRHPLVWKPSADWSPAVFIALTLLLFEIGLGLYSVASTARTGEIRMDQGQNTYRAAVLLLRGENPYGRGQLLDLEAFKIRQGLRQKAGIGPQVNDTELAAVLQDFWETLDPELKHKLLPVPGPEASSLAHREASLLGYKYGPVLFLLVLPLARLLGPTTIPLLNLAAFLAWIAVLWAILRNTALPRWTWAIVIASVLATCEIPLNFLIMTSSDIWPLLFSSLGLFAFLRHRPVLLGVALGIALGSKFLPAALFLPLLLLRRSSIPLLCTALVTAGLNAPFVAWDPQAFLLNVLRWPALMEPDSTSWVFYAPPAIIPVARIIIALAIAFVFWRLVTSREEYLFRALAVVNLLIVLGGGAFHNNYVTWFAPWLFFALAEAMTATKTLPRAAGAPAGWL